MKLLNQEVELLKPFKLEGFVEGDRHWKRARIVSHLKRKYPNAESVEQKTVNVDRFRRAIKKFIANLAILAGL